MMKILIQFFIPIVVFLNSFNSVAQTIVDEIVPDQAEKELIHIVELINNQDINLAINKADQLIIKYPDFTLAKLMYSDLLYSKQNMIDRIFSIEADPAKREAYFSEVNVRLASKQNSIGTGKLPELVKYIDPKITHFILIDFSSSRLYLFENLNNQPRLLIDHYVTIGKNGAHKEKTGDKRTPVGVYHITGFYSDNQLPDLYGWGAFPINYPNQWDKLHQRSGSGIWLHGVPRNIYSRPPQDSRGCLTLSNELLTNISNYLEVDTPIIMANRLNWVKIENFHHQNPFLKTLQDWQNSWKNKEINHYLNYYSKSFSDGKKDFSAWEKHKKRVFRFTRSIKLDLTKISIIQYPNEENIISVNFIQNYRGDRYKSHGEKQQYWKREADGQWRIIYEKIIKS